MDRILMFMFDTPHFKVQESNVWLVLPTTTYAQLLVCHWQLQMRQE